MFNLEIPIFTIDYGSCNCYKSCLSRQQDIRITVFKYKGNKCPSSLTMFFGSLLTVFRRRRWRPTPVLLPGKSHGWRSLVGCSPWGRSESDRTERLHFHFSLSCIGEGNDNPLQCSCLENPRDGEAWWAAICGVSQSRTRLKRLSSSSSSSINSIYLHLHHAQSLHIYEISKSPGN